MLQLRIVCVGALKEAYWRQACAEYEKRLSGRCRVLVSETPEERLSERPSPAQVEAALAAEASRLLPAFSVAALRVALCVEGKPMSSEALAVALGDAMVHGASSAAFAIGGSFGLHDSVKQAATFRLSLSQMTLPHTLARVVLFEQLYRAFSILEGAKYHK